MLLEASPFALAGPNSPPVTPESRHYSCFFCGFGSHPPDCADLRARGRQPHLRLSLPYSTSVVKKLEKSGPRLSVAQPWTVLVS